MFAQSDYGLNN